MSYLNKQYVISNSTCLVQNVIFCFFFSASRTRSWERFHYGIHQHFLYEPDDVFVAKMLIDFTNKKIIKVGNALHSIFKHENYLKIINTFYF